jgi:hypothetical protein
MLPLPGREHLSHPAHSQSLYGLRYPGSSAYGVLLVELLRKVKYVVYIFLILDWCILLRYNQ